MINEIIYIYTSNYDNYKIIFKNYKIKKLHTNDILNIINMNVKFLVIDKENEKLFDIIKKNVLLCLLILKNFVMMLIIYFMQIIMN